MPLVGLCQFISLLQKSAQYVFIWITCQVISLPNSGTLSDITVSDIDVKEGDTVKVIAGPFADLTGKVTEVDHEKQKLKVNVNMFGRETSAELGFDQIDTVE